MLEFLAKKETKIAAVILAVIILTLTVVLVANQNNIKQTQKSLEHEAGYGNLPRVQLSTTLYM